VSRRGEAPGRVASLFFAIGCLSVLGLAFTGGVAAGRHWPRWLPSLGGPAAPIERDVAARKPVEPRPPAPVLTFYQELTAPLAAPPPPGKPKVDKPQRSGAETGGETRVNDTRYAVQVGAFKERGPADAMRVNLAAAGWDAYLAEIEGPDVVRYRVRVGSYTSRDEARQAAQRLSTERRVSTYVTIR
jgi:cell division protein FtsN